MTKSVPRCPVRLDDVTGDVELELDVITGMCTEIDVGICAGIESGDGSCVP